MSYTEPPTFVADTILESDDLNILSEDVRYLKSTVDGLAANVVSVRRAATQSIANGGTGTTISFDTENLDIGGWWSSGTNVVVPAGAIPSGSTLILVYCKARLRFSSNSTGIRRLKIQVNGTDITSWSASGLSGGDPTEVQDSEYAIVAAGDIITLVAYQTSGGALNVTEASLAVERRSAAD